jgi:hypothetical protein
MNVNALGRDRLGYEMQSQRPSFRRAWAIGARGKQDGIEWNGGLDPKAAVVVGADLR